jgi:redox-sensitive bicupin YhaK (pirin superfamily)
VSTLDQDVDAPGRPFAYEGYELSEAREARVGDLNVRRLLPLRLRRSVGAWCFVDHYGPTSVDGVKGMVVPPHPHIGLQTVTWLFAGDVLHKDSLGTEQMIRPGQLNLMTAGRGIAHSEESPAEHDPSLHGVQLWVALPDAARQAAPAFEHHAQLPATRQDGLHITVFLGGLTGTVSPATTFSHLVGAQLSAYRDVRTSIALADRFEHVMFVAHGRAEVAGAELRPGQLLYLPPGHDETRVAAPSGTTMLLLGGIPLGEPLLMWWNFVARTPQEITAAVADWDEGKFGAVTGYAGAPLKAPPLRTDLLVARR